MTRRSDRIDNPLSPRRRRADTLGSQQGIVPTPSRSIAPADRRYEYRAVCGNYKHGLRATADEALVDVEDLKARYAECYHSDLGVERRVKAGPWEPTDERRTEQPRALAEGEMRSGGAE